MKPRILVVEDEDKLRRVIALHLSAEGWEVDEASSAEHALPKAASAAFILTDLKLPGLSGIDLLRGLRERNARAPVVLMTAFGTIENAVEAMKEGATDFLLKPFSLDQLSAVLNKAREVQALRDENTRLRDQLDQRYRFDQIIAAAPSMQEALQSALRVAPARSTVLLCGESGVGKDLLARVIHHHSPRRDQPFVKINCTAIPENLLESELFGYEKGAFTGASVTKPGKFEQADTGTAFLDEIGDVPLTIQVKLLRIIQDREFERLGSNRSRQVDVRVVAATNVDLRQALEAGAFREDLYYRLNVFPITIPPLRERREDIPLLAERFLFRVSREQGAAVTGISPEALAKLVDWQWPGNVRELENVIERSVLLAAGTVLQPGDIRLDAVRNHSSPAASGFLPDGVTLEQHEQDLIREALRRADGNKSQAARLLGLTRNALRYRLSQMGLE
jgi:two-component system, NtrC family, response regulator AtoC